MLTYADACKVHLENAIRLDPTWADAHNNYGNTLLAFQDMTVVRRYRA